MIHVSLLYLENQRENSKPNIALPFSLIFDILYSFISFAYGFHLSEKFIVIVSNISNPFFHFYSTYAIKASDVRDVLF